MKTFNVFKHPTQGYEAIKQGWSWPAFFFNGIWAFVKKLWVVGISYWVIVFTILIVAAVIIETKYTGNPNKEVFSAGMNGLTNILFFIIALVFGKKGNVWRQGNLIKRGFEKLDTVDAETSDAAIASTAKHEKQ